MMILKRLSGQLRRHALVAERPTAFKMERTSVGTVSCDMLDASIASTSALSLPGIPQCAGIHCVRTRRPPSVSVRSSRHTAAPSAVVWPPAPLASVASAAWESAQTMTELSVGTGRVGLAVNPQKPGALKQGSDSDTFKTRYFQDRLYSVLLAYDITNVPRLHCIVQRPRTANSSTTLLRYRSNIISRAARQNALHTFNSLCR